MLAVLLSLSFSTFAADKVYFVMPQNHASVKSPVKIKMGLDGMKVRPAGEDLADKRTGHHHVIVDGSAIPEGQVIAANETHIHFGKGQTETEVVLKPGKHTLTLQFADGAHRSYGPAISQTIEITVTK